MIADYRAKLRTVVNHLETENRPFAIAMQSTIQLMGNRIFIRGENSAGGKIGTYNDTKGMYIKPKKSAGAVTGNKQLNIAGLLPTKGITGEHKFKDGTAHKTTYVKSYKEYRKLIDRESEKVNLVLSGDLQSDWRNTENVKTLAKPVRLSANEYEIRLDRVINQKKMEKFDDKYGKISAATTAEKKNLNRVALNEFLNYLTKIGLV